MTTQFSAFATVEEAVLWIHQYLHKMAASQLSQILIYIERAQSPRSGVTVVVVNNYTTVSKKELVDEFMTIPGGC
jgi:hypothetical protein